MHTLGCPCTLPAWPYIHYMGSSSVWSAVTWLPILAGGPPTGRGRGGGPAAGGARGVPAPAQRGVPAAGGARARPRRPAGRRRRARPRGAPAGDSCFHYCMHEARLPVALVFNACARRACRSVPTCTACARRACELPNACMLHVLHVHVLPVCMPCDCDTPGMPCLASGEPFMLHRLMRRL